MTPKHLISAVLVMASTATAVGVFIAHHRADSKAQSVRQRTPEQEAEIVTKAAHDADETVKVARLKELREFPADIDTLLRSLSHWGYWAPGETSMKDGRFTMTSARYEGDSPAKHSFRALASAGALEDSARGHVALYMILASEADKERGRKTDGEIPLSVGGGQSWLSFQGEDLGAVFTTSDAAQKTLVEMRELQRILGEYQIELIAENFLAE
jgi:hypothetical protein